ncbi:integrase catalytic domain-containing protein [Geochorda subterranea]|uniref:Transposase family protein n=1 Tax=Geochorda subterranea TaxID=3109564 RepID=A0ABZ1BQP1_9FIRM|nr:transposase family protein [Limnochorda sp. LNt]WRP15129.1 transposase family protein [Limnochorda sp. LNt]
MKPKEAQEVPLSLPERRAVVRELAERYRKARKKEKAQILSQLQQLCGYNRSYAARALRQASRPGSRRVARVRVHRTGRPPVYTREVKEALVKVWAILSFPAGKRLAPFLPEVVPILERWGELSLTPEVRERLLRISAATVDRLLARERQRLQIKGRSGTKPGSLLKGAIPIRTFAEWDDTHPGFLEIDLVGHDGGNPKGDFAQTLDMVDVATGWTVTVAVPNKAQRWVLEALKRTLPAFPFPIRGIDSDNGAEFINAHLKRFCESRCLTFTRSRPYQKNDSCHVEQKNWAVVRHYVGYLRYDTPEQVALLNTLYPELRLYTNFFQPTQKLVRKERHGARVRRIYDAPATPYARVLASPDVSEADKAALRALYATLNPAALRRRITALQEQLRELTRHRVRAAQRPGAVPNTAAEAREEIACG